MVALLNKLILSLDGGGARAAATTEFLSLIEQQLQCSGKTLRDEVDFFAGTSAGGTIALALACTDKSLDEINYLHGEVNAARLFQRNSRWPFIGGVLRPKYQRRGKLEVLQQILGEARLGDIAAHQEALLVSYDVNARTPLVIKSTEPDHRSLLCTEVVDATSAAPTFFPTAAVNINTTQRWLIDGGVVANNPALCAIAEARRRYQTSIDQMRLLSIGTGHRTAAINGKASQRWGAIQWALKGQIMSVLSDERIVAYQAQTITRPGSYIRVDSELSPQPGLPNPPQQAMDCVTRDNIARIRDMGKFWFDQYGEAVVQLIFNQYQGPSIGRIDARSGRPMVLPDDETGAG